MSKLQSPIPQAPIPQAPIPQASIPQASIPQASIPQASVPQASVPQASILQAPIHPGEHLAEFLEEYGISEYRLAKTINVAPVRINRIVKGKQSITADTAVRLGKAFGMSAEFWLNLQKFYELSCARQIVLDDIEPLIEPPVTT